MPTCQRFTHYATCISLLQKDERYAVSVCSDGSHRHDSDIVATESEFFDQVVPHYCCPFTRAQELFIERTGHCIPLNDDGSIGSKSEEVRHHRIEFFSSRI